MFLLTYTKTQTPPTLNMVDTSQLLYDTPDPWTGNTLFVLIVLVLCDKRSQYAVELPAQPLFRFGDMQIGMP
jgi:hypothetical protein